jgi:predicted Zn-dependent protease
MFLYFHNKKLQRQIDSELELARLDMIRYETIANLQGADSPQAQRMLMHVRTHEQEADRIKRKLSRGGF